MSGWREQLVALAARHVLPAMYDVREFTAATGIRPTAGGRHVGRGTANYLVGLGNNAYLEIIGPDPDEPAPPERLTFGIERLTSSQLITWAVAVTDIDTAIARSRSHGYDPGDATAMSRRTAAYFSARRQSPPRSLAHHP